MAYSEDGEREARAPRAGVIIVMGVSGAGKTTVGISLAETLGWHFVDADSFHTEANIEKMQQGVGLDDADRGPWLEAMREAIGRWLREETPTVLACSALRREYRNKLRVEPERMRFVYLKGEPALLEQRLRSRKGHFAGTRLLQSQLAALEEPRDAIVVDTRPSVEEIVAEIVRRLEAESKS